jgi:hypothetical protein
MFNKNNQNKKGPGISTRASNPSNTPKERDTPNTKRI